MTPEERAREALLRCVSKPPWLEEYEPEVARAIREAVEAEHARITEMAEQIESGTITTTKSVAQVLRAEAQQKLSES